MIITNKQNLPTAFVKMAQEQADILPYRYRVTSLLKGTRETLLTRRHDSEIEMDCSEMIWLLFGTAAHSILERQEAESSQLKETEVKTEIGEYTLTGHFDLYDEETQTITDYKTCSVWKVIFGDYTDWAHQLLIYAYMLRKHGFPVKRGEIVAIMKDHNKSKAKFDSAYPQLPVKKITFNFTEKSFVEIEEWLKEKFKEIKRCEQLPDDELPVCTLEERYNKGDKYAVMRKGRKTALRVLDSEGEANEYIDTQNEGGLYIEVRPGEDKKCDEYCACREFCSYWKGKQNG